MPGSFGNPAETTGRSRLAAAESNRESNRLVDQLAQSRATSRGRASKSCRLAWLTAAILYDVTRGLRLLPDYGEGSPVWSASGRLMRPDLGISDSLWRELLDWQAAAYDDGWSGVDRSEDEWDEKGKRLANRLAAEMVQPVEYVP